MKIDVATSRPLELEQFMLALSQAGAEVRTVLTGAQVLDLAKSEPPNMVVVDQVPDLDPLPMVSKLMTINAMVNTAVITDMDPEEFHEESEGLGILKQLPPKPGAADAEELVELLRGLMG